MSKTIQKPLIKKSTQFLIVNDNPTTFKNAEYTAHLDAPLLDDQENWLCAVSKFRIPLISVPLMFFEEDAYKITFAIGLANTDPLAVRTITYDFPSTTDPSNRAIYHHDQLIACINNKLKELWIVAIGNATYQAFISDPSLRRAWCAPYLRRTPNSAILEICLPIDNALDLLASPFGDTAINIIMSSKLYYFFAGFPDKYYSSGINGNIELQHKLLFLDINKRDVINIPKWNAEVAHTMSRIQQSYSSLHLWQMVNSIFITSGLLHTFKDRVFCSTRPDTRTNIEVLAEFEIPTSETNEWRDDVLYTPYGNLKWSNFTGSGEIKDIDLKIYYQTKDLKAYPIKLPPNVHCKIELKFKRRYLVEYYEYDEEHTSKEYATKSVSLKSTKNLM